MMAESTWFIEEVSDEKMDASASSTMLLR